MVDVRLCELIEHTWQQGDPKAWPTSARPAVIFVLPTSRSTLRGSQRLVKAWGKKRLSYASDAAATPRFLLAPVNAALRGRDLRLAEALIFDGCLSWSPAYRAMPAI